VEGIEIVFTVYELRETLHDNREEGVERAKSCIVAFGHLLLLRGFDPKAALRPGVNFQTIRP
jgi:hypothetical protein